MNSYTYRIIIEPDENNTFHGYAPSLPGCHTWGDSLEETRKNLADAIRAYLASLLAEGQTIPREAGFESFETVSEQDVRPLLT